MGYALLAEAARRQLEEVNMFTSVAPFCRRHRRRVLAAWVLLFVAGTVIGSRVFSRLKDSNGGSGSESVQGASIVAKAATVGPSAVVLVNGPPVAAASTRASVQAPTARLERVPQAAGAVSAYTSADPMLPGAKRPRQPSRGLGAQERRRDGPDDGRGCDALTRFW
jgi:hypothetical protein